MPRKGDPLFVPNTGKGVQTLLNLDQIPEDVKKEVEEIYEYLKANPDGRMRVEFDNKTELAVYTLQVRSYCANRPESLGGKLYFRKSPAQGLTDAQMDFRVTDPKADEASVPEPSTPAGQEWRTQTGKRKNAG